MGLKNVRRQLPVNVRLGFPITMGGPIEERGVRRAVLEVRDETAAIILLELELTPEQLMGLLAGSPTHGTASMPARLDHVGKQMKHGQMTWDDGYHTGEPMARVRAEAWRDAEGWETLNLRLSHGKWHATGRRWVDPPAAQQ